MATRRTFLKSGAVLFAAGLAGDAAAWEPDYPGVTRLDVILRRLSPAWNGLRIVQLSDFHYDPYFSVTPIRHAVEIVGNLQPDLIVLTGDFITETQDSRWVFSHTQKTEYVRLCAALLGRMRSRLGSFAIMGNHDVKFGADAVIEALQANDIHVLRNSSIPLEQNGSRLWLAGVDDVLEGKPELDVSLQQIPEGEPVILLAHEPDYVLESARSGVDLQLSGHSHGGQIRIPFLGAPYLPELGRKYPMGSYQINDTQLYTNVGLGTITIPFRFDCRAEISVFTLRSGTPGTAPLEK